MTINAPNLLTLMRILLIPAFVGVFWLDKPAANWVALGLFTVAGVTDFFDGYLARKWGQLSRFGQLMDPIADKLLVGAAIVMVVHKGPMQDITVIALIVILCREILVSGLREFLAGTKVSMPVSTLAKWKTTVQMIALGFLIAGEAGEQVLPGTTLIGVTGIWFAALLTLYTGYDYLRAGLTHAGDGP